MQPLTTSQTSRRQVAGSSTSAVALGSTPFGFADASADTDSIRSLHAAFDAGINVVDTALCYTSLDEPQHAERVIAEALRTSPHEVFVATKGGHWRNERGEFPVDGRPETLRRHCELSLKVLGTDSVWLYYLHWPDPEVPIEESTGALADLQSEGKIRHIGLSNVDVRQLARARTVTGIAAVQNPFSLLNGGDQDVLDECTSSDISFFAYGALGGPGQAKQLGDLLPATGKVAAARDASPQRVALAWLLAQSPSLIALVGASSPATIHDALAAAELQLDDAELTHLDRARENR
jgi:aryl-alcohol dehydrogenase-like predicted oxidoreductase